jgi:peptidoglycan hydrolase-like protein with peptidoglycan-binding domain
MSTLTKGARGDKVKELQKMLIDNGLLDKQYATGYFGPLTENALKAFQSKAGLPTSGSFDDITSHALNNIGGADIIDNHPNLVGTQLGNYIDNLKTTDPTLYYTIAGATKNGFMLTPGMVIKARQQAAQQVTPYFTEQANNSRGILNNYLNSTLGKYSTDMSGLQDSAKTDFEDLQDKEGQNGTWASSARTERMNSLQNKYNNAFSELYNTNKGSIAEKLQGQEYNYGADATPKVNLDQTTADFSRPAANFSATSSSVYNPFNFSGIQNENKKSAIDKYTNLGVASQTYPLEVKENNE